MKIGKISLANISTEAVSFGGAVLGGAVSDGAMAIIPAEHKTAARYGMTGGGILLASIVKGKDSISQALKMAGIGIAVKQGLAAIRDFAEGQISVDDTSMASRFVGGAVGLACPCESGGSYTALNAAPVINFEPAAPRIPSANKASAY
ncbi:hypothetical protein SAMN04487907_101259 [Zunongwangia mangrovi]|uniref:Uncharacterized protein n=1 Tax=Zunongwangia mangrovi TaxID=1334022 RepID=A0A1I1DD18_9FLAO|nr:hypothetical protein [Zunongwangia mangrovi]SFB72252.1 hypothetical protein SAMN04487907_101259 [Zunongwangia mangrovi]